MMYKNWETTTLKLCVHSDKENPISAEKKQYFPTNKLPLIDIPFLDTNSDPYPIDNLPSQVNTRL